MIVRPEMRQYELLDILLEFTYVPLKEAELTGADARALTADAVVELPLVTARLAEAPAILPLTRAGRRACRAGHAVVVQGGGRVGGGEGVVGAGSMEGSEERVAWRGASVRRSAGWVAAGGERRRSTQGVPQSPPSDSNR